MKENEKIQINTNSEKSQITFKVSEEIITSHKKYYGVKKRRFLVLVCVCLASFVNGYQWTIISPIFDEFKEISELNDWQLSLFGNLYYVAFIPMIYFSFKVIEKSDTTAVLKLLIIKIRLD